MYRKHLYLYKKEEMSSSKSRIDLTSKSAHFYKMVLMVPFIGVRRMAVDGQYVDKEESED